MTTDLSLDTRTELYPDAARSLESEVRDSLKTAASGPRLLRALAAVEPGRALRWLAEGKERFVEAITARDAVAVLEAVASDAVSRRDGEIALAVGEVLHELGLTPSVQLVRTLSSVLDRAARVRLLGAAAEKLLARHPSEPELVSAAVEYAIAAGAHERAHSLLTRLGRASASPAVIQIVKRLRAELPPPPGTPVRIALLSSFTMDPLVPFLDVECRASQLLPDVYVAPFNSWERELRDARSGLCDFQPEIVFLAVSIDDLVPALSDSVLGTELADAAESALARIVSAIQAFRAASDCALVVHGFHTAFADTLVSGGQQSQTTWLRDLNTRLERALNEVPNVFMLDLQDVQARGAGASDDARLRHFGRIRLGYAALPAVARAYVRVIVPWKGLTRKCVVLDLDNTLWGGVIGEDGLNGLRLGDTAPGSEYVELQRYLKSLAGRGFLLAIASKNNESDALEVIRMHDAMVLRQHDVVATRINWQPKPENVQSIADELNIGLDAIVFVDDNPDERELMRQLLPQVLTVELPPDPAQYRATLESLPELQLLRVTAEDRERTQMYRARHEREDARVSAFSMDDFLASLNITVEIAPLASSTVSRVQQLFQRTNQFNLTTRRYDVGTVESRQTGSDWRVLTLRASDRFSDHGLVAAAMIATRDDEWHIDNLVLSCRAIGYGVETALLAHTAEVARSAGVRRLGGEFIPSDRNTPARDFFARHGFTLDNDDDGRQRWSHPLTNGGVRAPAWITVKAADDT